MDNEVHAYAPTVLSIVVALAVIWYASECSRYDYL